MLNKFLYILLFFFFFFKQKTAYEIYQCDWSSDVCSSDLKRLLSQLHIETFLLDTREEIVDVPELDGYTLLKIDAHTLAVDVAKEKGLNRLFIQLSDHGITILSLRNKTNRLEELFMNMVNENKKPDAEY